MKIQLLPMDLPMGKALEKSSVSWMSITKMVKLKEEQILLQIVVRMVMGLMVVWHLKMERQEWNWPVLQLISKTETQVKKGAEVAATSMVLVWSLKKLL